MVFGERKTEIEALYVTDLSIGYVHLTSAIDIRNMHVLYCWKDIERRTQLLKDKPARLSCNAL
jgi:hypothetical protein